MEWQIERSSGACGPGPTDGTPAPSGVVDGQAEDGAFRLTIHAERPTRRTSDAIGVSAILTYVGPEPTVDVLGSWAEIFGDPIAVAALVDRFVHHAEVIVLKGDRYRRRGKREEVLTGAKER